MDTVKSFNDELSGIYEAKPPISRAKMTMLTKKAIKGIKFYKHIVQSMEKFIQKCRPEYKVPGLYVVDSVVRQSRHQFGPEKDVFMPRLCKNIIATFQHIYKCPNEDKPRILRVLNLWQKNNVFPPEVVQQLMVMGGAPTPEGAEGRASSSVEVKAEPTDGPNLTHLLANLLANPDAGQINNLAGLLSSSQQNQLQGLLKQVKEEELKILEEGEVLESPEEKPPQPLVNNLGVKKESPNLFQPHENTHQPPFLHSNQAPNRNPPPSFNRAVLDFDYSDDEQTPPNTTQSQPPLNNLSSFNQLPSSDSKPHLPPNLPTPGQTHKLVGVPPDSFDRMKLEQEQEIFDKQIQQLSSHDEDKRNDSRKKRSRSRSRSRDRHRRRRSNRSRSRDRGHRSRRSRSRDRSRRSRRSHERRKEKNGLPPLREGCVSVCTTTLWIGNISARVLQHELQKLVEEFGAVESLNMIPPRGCAYVCMKDRLEASKALHKIRHHRLGGKSLKCDWAPSKGMPEQEKATWVKEHGVNYVPLGEGAGFVRGLTGWGFIDEESLPAEKRGDLQILLEEKEGPNLVEPSQHHPAPMGTMVGAPVQFGAPRMAPMVAPPVAMTQRPPMMIRPGFQVQGISPFGAMGFRPQQIPPNLSADPKPKEGNSTPTNDEQTDDIRPQMGIPQPHFQPQFGGVPQRFPGAMPMQIRMMPQQMMAPPPRVGVMPLRMGIPMQLRPGFHPQLQARMPMAGPPHMLASSLASPLPMHQLQQPSQQQPIRSPAQLGGFPIRMQRFAPPSVGEAAMSEAERDGEVPPRGIPPSPTGPPVRRQLSGGNPQDPGDGPRPEMTPAGRFGPRGGFNERGPHPRNNGGSPPPRGFDRPRDFERRPLDFERPRGRRDFERPPARSFERDRDGDRGRDNRGGDRGRDKDGDRGRREPERRRERSRSRDRSRREDRPPRDERRDRGPTDRGPTDRGPTDRGRFGRFDRDRRGGFNGGGFRGRGGGGRGGSFSRERSPDPEEEEYVRRRRETLRKRHEEEAEYVMEDADLAKFGLPAGFGGPMVFNSEVSAEAEEKEQKEEEDRNRRKKWLDEQGGSRRSRDRSPRRDRGHDRRDRSPKSVTTPTQDSEEANGAQENNKDQEKEDVQNRELSSEPQTEDKTSELSKDGTENSTQPSHNGNSEELPSNAANSSPVDEMSRDSNADPPLMGLNEEENHLNEEEHTDLNPELEHQDSHTDHFQPDLSEVDPAMNTEQHYLNADRQSDRNSDSGQPDSHPEDQRDSNHSGFQTTDAPEPVCTIESTDPHLDTQEPVDTMQYSPDRPGTPTFDESSEQCGDFPSKDSLQNVGGLTQADDNVEPDAEI